MGLTYSANDKKWNVSYEKTDYPTDKPVYDTMEVWAKQEKKTGSQKGQSFQFTVTTDYSVGINKNKDPNKGWVKLGDIPVNYSKEDLQKYQTTLGNFQDLAFSASKASSEIQSNNQIHQYINDENKKLNEENEALNANYDKGLLVISSTKGGDYLTQIEALKELNIKDIQDNFDTFYITEKITPVTLKAEDYKPLYGDFDATYYAKENPSVAEKWDTAVENGDLDITERYTNKQNFLASHYALQGKKAGKRGNAPEKTKYADEYIEKKPTDKDLQEVRDLQLGINTDSQTDRILKVPEIAAEWEKAKDGDTYWKKLAKESFLDINKKDDFVALFRLSDRDKDKQISLDYNVNAGYGITELEDAINTAVGAKATVDVKKFGALKQNVLKDTIEEMKKAKAKESTISLLGNLGGFSEITDINQELSNSILGDSGVGGMLSFTSGGKAEESLEKSLQNITGVRNNATYNWQQWFDDTLKKKYDQELKLGYTADEAKKTIKIEADFASTFIDKYLKPRFDTARSMDEFKEYLDVRQEEQNPFQTQDMFNAVSLVAELRAKKYLDDIKKEGDRSFDADFYFNPTGNKAAEDAYAEQAKTVAADWKAAKEGDSYWKQQAYRFGIDITDKDAFARMHFEVKGQGKGYDPAENILTASKVQDYIFDEILPALKKESLKQGTIFGQFVTPDEFADEMLKGLDPTDKENWNEALQKFGLDNFKGTTEELKQYIAETLRTGSAQEIREQIKYLNEKRRKPTQQILGLTYIEREEDYKNEQATPETELYKVFQSAGFQGTEDEFYENFFPDVDRSEQTLLTKAGSDSALKIEGLDFSDPFASLGTIESFFSDDEKTTLVDDDENVAPKTSSFFSLGLDDNDNDTDYKSKTGSQILGEFTSMLKGL